ncbi:MAG TPA: thioesterase domain-containing protein [Micromonosporaceae bacterium]|nr:thioesterase domain-containing protein [Micromonosporaceae bacterium]
MTAPTAANDAGAAVAPSTTFEANGVRVERLRAGRAGGNLFLVPGLEGDPTELTAVVSAFVGPQEVYAVAPLAEDAERQPVVGVERMAELIVCAIRRVQPAGPYRLGGYSFGGLIALETAQQLRAAGEAVDALFLIEAVFDERFWPRGTWLRALARRTGRQLARIGHMPMAQAAAELRLRSGRLRRRVMRRATDDPERLSMGPDDANTMSGLAYSSIAGYRPRFYDGTITLIASSIDRHFGCDTVKLWAGYADHLDVARVDGDHLTVMHDNASAAVVANVIDHRLARSRATWAGLRPMPGFERPMLLSTMRWFSAARLAHALTEAGFTVSACRPRSHPLEVVEGIVSDHRLSRLRRSRSVVVAIRRAAPDIVLPDDERALALLRRIHARTRRTEPAIAAVIAHSVGAVDHWPSITSRSGLAMQARALDVAAPETAVISDSVALEQWVARHGMPVVLKTDGSWGGRGVAVVRDGSRLREAWRNTSNPPRLTRGVKRMVFNLEAGALAAWLRRARPVVNAQQYVGGREAIATVACLHGEVQALVCLEVVQATEARGPAAVVRIVDHPAMAEAARRLVRRFGLTGFCGFDFIITDSGEARLLEMNPRVTPTCHLLVEGDYQRTRTIALFPAELVRNGQPLAAVSSVLDVPVRAPQLIQRGEWMAARQHRPAARMMRRVTRRWATPTY